ncbi:hypothetical protein CAOG_06027 [Capsaspora owczarzaki ATCC 30864]|uniref:LNR domain-containing protein n=1 Tax=Capsaspora owczarzaki (strain ATCC 30864) TaxID=595528 RepID=A0A0D2VVS9_CAPO3|nr:hypothetical protein CAOG_06027 [Capsaspora owczarzaki ATCC 30864]KJE95587.1 hypothetical protein CAOG_006027 [Capsaspora owczarzaki ATCC 30864]|eukprot:XP_004345617.1 hypothetical protein CAOG_06027 [Capsaspora owczarzaki ATCC 30864]
MGRRGHQPLQSRLVLVPVVLVAAAVLAVVVAAGASQAASVGRYGVARREDDARVPGSDGNAKPLIARRGLLDGLLTPVLNGVVCLLFCPPGSASTTFFTKPLSSATPASVTPSSKTPLVSSSATPLALASSSSSLSTTTTTTTALALTASSSIDLPSSLAETPSESETETETGAVLSPSSPIDPSSATPVVVVGGSASSTESPTDSQTPTELTSFTLQTSGTATLEASAASTTPVGGTTPSSCANLGFCAAHAGNGICDVACDNAACGNDGGDCNRFFGVPLADRPFDACQNASYCASVFNNGVCDWQCNSYDCNFDGLDCRPQSVRDPLMDWSKCPFAECEAAFTNNKCDLRCAISDCFWDNFECVEPVQVDPWLTCPYSDVCAPVFGDGTCDALKSGVCSDSDCPSDFTCDFNFGDISSCPTVELCELAYETQTCNPACNSRACGFSGGFCANDRPSWRVDMIMGYPYAYLIDRLPQIEQGLSTVLNVVARVTNVGIWPAGGNPAFLTIWMQLPSNTSAARRSGESLSPILNQTDAVVYLNAWRGTGSTADVFGVPILAAIASSSQITPTPNKPSDDSPSSTMTIIIAVAACGGLVLVIAGIVTGVKRRRDNADVGGRSTVEPVESVAVVAAGAAGHKNQDSTPDIWDVEKRVRLMYASPGFGHRDSALSRDRPPSKSDAMEMEQLPARTGSYSSRSSKEIEAAEAHFAHHYSRMPVARADGFGSDLHAAAATGDLHQLRQQLDLLAYGSPIIMSASSSPPPPYSPSDPAAAAASAAAAAAGASGGAATPAAVPRAPVDAADDLGNTALHLACWNGQIDTAVLLISAGANPNLSNYEGRTPLHCACVNGHAELVAAIITACNVLSETPRRASSIETCSSSLSSRSSTWSGHDANLLHNRESSPHSSSGIDQFGEPAARGGENGEAALSSPVPSQAPSARDSVLSSRSMSDASPSSGATFATQSLSPASTTATVPSLAASTLPTVLNVNALDNRRRSPLHLACAGGNASCVEVLLNAASHVGPWATVRLNLADEDGTTALMSSVKLSDEIATTLLVTAGASTKPQDRMGFSALHWAAALGDIQVLSRLLQHRIEIDAVNNKNETPLMLAVREGHAEAVHLLLSKHSNRKIENNEDKTAFDIATARGDATIVRMLNDWTISSMPKLTVPAAAPVVARAVALAPTAASAGPSAASLAPKIAMARMPTAPLQPASHGARPAQLSALHSKQQQPAQLQPIRPPLSLQQVQQQMQQELHHQQQVQLHQQQVQQQHHHHLQLQHQRQLQQQVKQHSSEIAEMGRMPVPLRTIQMQMVSQGAGQAVTGFDQVPMMQNELAFAPAPGRSAAPSVSTDSSPYLSTHNTPVVDTANWYPSNLSPVSDAFHVTGDAVLSDGASDSADDELLTDEMFAALSGNDDLIDPMCLNSMFGAKPDGLMDLDMLSM